MNPKDKAGAEAPVTLTDEAISSAPAVGRRSMLKHLGTALTGAAAVAAVGSTGCVVHTTTSGITDSDAGPNSDPAGNGRGGGITDSDAGPNSDPAGGGRGGGGGITDSDSGPNADPAGGGRGSGGGVTDSDGGSCADPAGRGRGPQLSGVTDSDGGGCSDPAGAGRYGR